MNKGIIYYTDNRIQGHQIWNLAQQYINDVGLHITSCSLAPINFGDIRLILEGKCRSYPTMAEQILMALEASPAKYVFFCEHDVLYHPSHFEFTPEKDDIYYYNNNIWRWAWSKDYLITYERLLSLSAMCCNRETAIKHYRYRLKVIKEKGLDEIRSREPRWARRFGYEPGTKPLRRGGITNEEFETFKSEFPIIDIRHGKTFSRPKVTLEEFIHKPPDFTTAHFCDIQGWDLKGLFGL